MSWLRPGGWGMVVLQPGELPENADRKRYIQALATFEKIHDPDTAQAGYRAAVRRWPQDPLLLFSAGNNALKRNDLARAEEYYQEVLKNAPEHLAAMNNLAHTLALRGCFDSAQKTIRRAVVLAEQKKTVFTALIKCTEKEIQELSRGSGK